MVELVNNACAQSTTLNQRFEVTFISRKLTLHYGKMHIKKHINLKLLNIQVVFILGENIVSLKGSNSIFKRGYILKSLIFQMKSEGNINK